ncbi:CidA/LrgA family protein [Periweissella beninensis]|uniref:CidA/LrgA family protein n=1 Tax=Periweissella beninensis TaxID=504936 RepID=A0ABT0VGC6_9LACO|nr:CidA/LrgA family protein [Periweissella beninensis]MBM7543492.1 holin-like protein [Periweissella beninensis]MCM2436474.1 CidA/LrgA family protein [Periweissella beninensis]MCT4396192.1 murein hydrolase regulator LrgA [Periweissella beninensis]
MSGAQIYKILKAICIYLIVLFISYIMSFTLAKIFPTFPIPTPLIGLVLLYVALEVKLVKVEDIDGLSSLLIGLIGLLFVPSGISIITSLDILKSEGVKLILVIILSTIIMLVSVAWTTKYVFKYLTKKGDQLSVDNDIAVKE